jgi:hypothetical protein
MNRIFISYRSADGKKDADRLCADLSRLYGADQVFFDKQDLRGGMAWRSAIEQTLGTRPVVLLLITPALLGEAHPEGGRRIDRDDDPIVSEMRAAREGGAIVVPLLTEGTLMPPLRDWPEALRFIPEAHALKLRTDDWADDVDRIVEDLTRHGIAPPGATTAAQPLLTPARVPLHRSLIQRVQRAFMWVGAFVVALIVLAIVFDDDSNDLLGTWQSIDAQGRALPVHITKQGEEFVLTSDPVPVARDLGWQAYAQRMRAQGIEINALVYTARGPWDAQKLEGPVQVRSADGGEPLDTGSLTLKPGSDGRSLQGELWSNGSQSAEAILLRR